LFSSDILFFFSSNILFLISSIDLGIYFSSMGEDSSYFLLDTLFEYNLAISGDISAKSFLSIDRFIL